MPVNHPDRPAGDDPPAGFLFDFPAVLLIAVVLLLVVWLTADLWLH